MALGPLNISGQAVIIFGVSLTLMVLLCSVLQPHAVWQGPAATAVNRLGARLMGISTHSAGQTTFAWPL
jgi:branched-chain amino acid transport system permease protein